MLSKLTTLQKQQKENSVYDAKIEKMTNYGDNFDVLHYIMFLIGIMIFSILIAIIIIIIVMPEHLDQMTNISQNFNN